MSRLPLFQASSLLWPESAVEDGPSTWALHPMGDQDKYLAPAIGSAVHRPQRTGHSGHWRVNQRQKEDLSLCLSLSLTVHSACQKKHYTYDLVPFFNLVAHTTKCMHIEWKEEESKFAFSY